MASCAVGLAYPLRINGLFPAKDRRELSADTRCSTVHELRSALASSNRLCMEYRDATANETRRNRRLVEEYQLLRTQHKAVVDELAALASRHRSLRRELDDMYTDILARDAEIREYERRFTIQSQLNHVQPGIENDTDQLVAKIAELENERSDMKKALVSATELLVAARWKAEMYNRD